jgi:AraC family ethanolamine operon transcriptional activator
MESFRDLDDLNHAVSGSDLELVQLKPGSIDGTLSQVSLGDLSIDCGTVNLPLRARGALDARRFSLGTFLPGARATWNGHHVDGSQLIFFVPGKELNGYLSEGYGWTSLVVPPDWMASIAQTAWRSNMLQLTTDCRTLRPHPERLADLRNAAAHIVSPGGIPADPALADWLIADVRNALGAALSSLDTSPVKVMSRALAHFSMAHRAERYMRERIGEPLCIDDLCVAMHASRRYLEYAFADAFGTSPSRYLRLLRLHEVRHRLKSRAARTTVTDEALRLGFNHLSLFSIQYRKAFGESPSTTLEQATTPSARRRLPARPTDTRADCR